MKVHRLDDLASEIQAQRMKFQDLSHRAAPAAHSNHDDIASTVEKPPRPPTSSVR